MVRRGSRADRVHERPVDPALEATFEVGLIAPPVSGRVSMLTRASLRSGPWSRVPGTLQVREPCRPLDRHHEREEIGTVRLAPELPPPARGSARQRVEEALDLRLPRAL